MTSVPEAPSGNPGVGSSSEDLSPSRHWLVSLAVWFGWLPRLWFRTYRLVDVRGREPVERLLEKGRPAILVAWHDRMLGCGHYLRKRLVQRGSRLAVLSSLSRDGEIFAQLSTRAGFEVVRGSATRGGRQGLRKLYRTVKHEGISVGTAPDGPHGPAHEVKPGTIVLAQITGAPIIPLSCASRPTAHLTSWDRMAVPLPFAKVAVVVGDPIEIPSDLSSEEMQARATELGRILDALKLEAERAL